MAQNGERAAAQDGGSAPPRSLLGRFLSSRGLLKQPGSGGREPPRLERGNNIHVTGPSASPPPHHLQRVVGELLGPAIGIDLSIPAGARLRSVCFGRQFYKSLGVWRGWPPRANLAPNGARPARQGRRGKGGSGSCLLGGFGATFVLVLVLLFVPTPTRTVFLRARAELILAPGRQPLLFPSTLLFLLWGLTFFFSSFTNPLTGGRRF